MYPKKSNLNFKFLSHYIVIHRLNASLVAALTSTLLEAGANPNRFLIYGYQPGKGQPKLNQLLPFWQRYWPRVVEQSETVTVMPEYDSFRWQLEEFQVSLFAQKLKTVGLSRQNGWKKHGEKSLNLE